MLLITCINYVNLATARAAKRARIIGLRKILGADRALEAELLGESVLFALLGTALGVIAVEAVISLPSATALFGTPLDLDLLGNPLLTAAIVAFGVLVGRGRPLSCTLSLRVRAGIRVLDALSGAPGSSCGRRSFRAVHDLGRRIASTLVMTAQCDTSRAERSVSTPRTASSVPLRGVDLIERHDASLRVFKWYAGVLGVTTSQTMMGRGVFRDGNSQVEANDGSARRFGYQDMGHVGADFVSVLGMQVIEGRDFSATLGTEAERAAIVNETFVREMGWDEPIGKKVGTDATFSGRVIGVVEDFHFQSLHERIVPFVIFRGDGDYSGQSAAQRALAERLMVINVAQ